jgi:hypothetical protein
MEHLINCQTAAALLDVSISATHRLCVRGTLGYRLVAGRRLFVRAEVLGLLEDPAYRRRSRAKREVRK